MRGGITLSRVKCSAIEWLARFGRDPFALLIVGLAGLGTANILVRTAPYGAGVGPASIAFFPIHGHELPRRRGLANFRRQPAGSTPALVPPAAGGLRLGWH